MTGLHTLSLGGSATGSSSTNIAGDSERGVSGMLWVHLLAGRGLRASNVGSTASTPVSSPGIGTSHLNIIVVDLLFLLLIIITGSTGLRDLYCVLECDRVHKARTVVSLKHFLPTSTSHFL